MKQQRRSFGSESIARLKSTTNALNLMVRLIRAEAISFDVAARELDRIQTTLYFLSRTPKGGK